LHKLCLSLNYRVITPLTSRLAPRQAYSIIRYTGRIGKGFDKPSFRFNPPTTSKAIEALRTSLSLDGEKARTVVRNFHLIETRVLLEHTWLARKKLDWLSQMIDMEAISRLGAIIRERGPLLLVSAHTAYYFLIPWALKALGIKISYVMGNPESEPHPHALSGIESARALSHLIPVVFTNDGNTVKRSADLLRQGYSLLIIIDAPGYRSRGQLVRIFGNEVWIPLGCEWIHQGARTPVFSVFSHVENIAKPYRIAFCELAPASRAIDLQRWAGDLECVVRESPSSWLSWFYLDDMR